MRKLLLGVLGLVFASYGFGQLDSYTVTVTASRTLTVQPDQIAFNVVVTAPVTVGLDDVIAAVGSAGITATNLSNVYMSPAGSQSYSQPAPSWSFSIAAPFAAMKDTITALGNLQQAIAKQNSGMTLSYQVIGTQVSAALQSAQTCPVADLMADARSQAQALGDAAGMGVGRVLALSDGSGQAPGIPSAVRIGAFVSGAAFVNQLPATQSCSVTVKFQLLG